jgi:hypothetical protein
MLGGEPGRGDRSQVRAAEQDDRSVWQAVRGEHAHRPAGVMQSIAVVKMAGQVEEDLAETLRTLAAQDQLRPASGWGRVATPPAGQGASRAGLGIAA